jgi:SAM-dependent methyltransferase
VLVGIHTALAKTIITEPPPRSGEYLNPEGYIIRDYETYFVPFFNKLADHYHSRFKWFRDFIPRVDKIVNFGFGKNGAETFALMWALDAIEAVGFDKKPGSVEKADVYRNIAYGFANELVPMALEYSSPAYAERLESWYENKVSEKIRETILPIFRLGDLTTGVEWESDYFDLAYSRYVLDKIEEENRLTAIREMVRVVKPDRYIILVAPDELIPDNLTSLGVALVRTVDKEELGDLECPEDSLRGNIYLKE